MLRGFVTFLLVASLSLFVAGCSSNGADAQPPAGGRDTSDPAKALVDTKCSLCHTTERVYAADKTTAEWETTIARMKRNGLVVTDEEYDKILEFLGS